MSGEICTVLPGEQLVGERLLSLKYPANFYRLLRSMLGFTMWCMRIVRHDMPGKVAVFVEHVMLIFGDCR